VICQFGECNITSVETRDLAGHTRELLFFIKEVIKTEDVAFGAFAVHAHALFFHAECHEQNDH
jgi:hypothetical protein